MADDVAAGLAASPEVRAHLAVRNTGVYIVRQDGHIVWASASMEQVTGRKSSDLVGRNGWDVFVPHQDLPHVADFKVRLTGSDGVLWMRVPMPDGELKWFRVETWVRQDHILCAFKLENNQAEWHPHYVLRPRSRAGR